MLAGGWKSSASAKGTLSRCASAAPTVDFPDPDTPMTTIGARMPLYVPDLADHESLTWRKWADNPIWRDGSSIGSNRCTPSHTSPRRLAQRWTHWATAASGW